MVTGLVKMVLGLISFVVVLYALFGLLGHVREEQPVVPTHRPEASSVQAKTDGTPIRDKNVLLRTYSFRDHAGQERSLRYGIPKRHIEETEERYGFSKEELYRVLVKEAERFNAENQGRATVTVQKDLSWRISFRRGQEGLKNIFIKRMDNASRRYREARMVTPEGPISPDHRRIQAWQAVFVGPVYEGLKSLGMSSRANERDFIVLLSRFVQYLSYKIPSKTPYPHNRENLGFWPPVLCLREAGGDCDSKSTLFAALFYHFQRKSCVLLLTKQHAFIGIRDQHKVFPTDRYTRINGVDYLLIEMTSPQEMGRASPREVAYIRKGRHSMVVFE